MPSSSFTVSAVAGGGSKTQNVTSFVNWAVITRITVTPSAGGDSYKFQLFQADTFATADLAYDSGAVTDNPFSDPREDDGGVYTARTEDNLVVCVYQDEDATAELHVKITNNDASSRNFDVVVDYWSPALSGGLPGGQTINGGTAANEAITIRGTSHATKTTSYVLLQDDGGLVGIGIAAPTATLHIVNAANSLPATSGTTQTGHVQRWRGSGATTLDLGVYGTGGAVWLQGVSNADLSLTRQILINPNGGGLAVGTTSPNAKAALQVDSTTKGFLPPRMTTTQRDAIATPPAGLMIYNTSTNKLNVYSGTAWEAVTSA